MNNYARPLIRYVAIAKLVIFSALTFAGESAAQQLQTFSLAWQSGAPRIEYTYYESSAGNVRHGAYTEWYESGNVKETGSYAHGNKTGTWEYNWDTTDEYAVYQYVEGVKLQELRYDTIGNVIWRHDFDIDRPFPDVQLPAYTQTIEYYTEDGQPTHNRRSVLTSRSSDRPDGSGVYYIGQLTETYYRSGGLERSSYRANHLEPTPTTGLTGSQLEGLRRDFSEDGTLRVEYPYSEGVLHGTIRYWTTGGLLYWEVPALWGQKHGLERRWRTDTGVIEYEISWQSDKRHGPRTLYRSDGRISLLSHYGNDLLCGTSYSYSYDPDKVQTTYWGPCQPMDPVDPPPPPEDPGTPTNVNKSISGRLRHGSTGVILADVLVTAGSGSTTTDGRGYYQLGVGNVDTVTLTMSKEGYRTRSGSVPMAGVQRRIVNASLLPLAEDSSITDVTSLYGRIFLAGLSLVNEYTAMADWGGSDPGQVIFNSNDAERSVDADASGATASYNMGYDFNAVLNPRGNTLRIFSENVAGQRSAGYFELHPIVLPLPKWSLSLGLFEVEFEDGVFTYKMEASFPEEALAIEISPESLGALWSAWSLVPVVGGQKFGIPPSQIGMEVSVNTEGAGEIGASGTMGFSAAGGEIEAKLSGKGLLAYDLVGNAGLEWKGAELGGGLQGTIKREFGPVTVIPALAGAVSAPIIGRPIAWFNERAKIDASITVGGELKFILVNGEDGIEFDRTEGVVNSGVEVGLGGDLGKIQARVSGGGGVELTYQLPADPDYLKQVEAEVAAKLELTLWSYETSFESSRTFTYPEGTTQTLLQADEVSFSGPRLMNTAFVEAEPYNRFQAAPGRQVSAASEPGAPDLFVSNIFPYSEPAFAATVSNGALVYVSYDPERPVTQGKDLWYSLRTDGEWSAPLPLTADSHNDYAPRIAYTADGKLLAVWERVRPADYAGETLEELAPEIEIAWSLYNAETAIWSPPEFMTENAVLDFAPMLVQSPTGELMLFWLHSPGNHLIGDQSEPLELYAAAWNGAGFNAPIAHPYAFSNAFDFTYGYDGVRMRVAWIQDGDGDLTTLADQQLHHSVFDGTEWSDPERLLPGEGPASRPTLLCTGPDQWELFWQRGDTLARLTDWTEPAVEIIRPGSGGYSFANYHLSRAADGRLLLLWRALEDATPDIYYRVFDAQHGVWSEDLRLTSSAGRETALAGGLCADGTILLFFTRERAGERLVDLFYGQYTPGRNLTADSSRYVFSPAKPALAEPVDIKVEVYNSGELACDDVEAAFYLGDPGQGGVLIDTVAVSPSPLAAGAWGEAELKNWVIPVDIGAQAVYVVVDPDGKIAERDKNDNLAIVHPVWIDLAVTRIDVGEVSAGDAVDLVATVVNRGNAVAENVDVRFSVDGRLLDIVTLPALMPGLEAQLGLTAFARTDFIAARTEVQVEADPFGSLPDIDRENNSMVAVVNRVVGRSSANDGLTDDWKRKYFGHLDVDPDDDADGDGFTNLEEFRAGSNPRDAGSYFHARPRSIDAHGTRRISWFARAGQRYRVMKSLDLRDWIDLRDEIIALQDGNLSVLDAGSDPGNAAFYRIIILE